VKRGGIRKKAVFAVAAIATFAWVTTIALGGTSYYSGSDLDSQCGQVAHTKCDVTFTGVKRKGGTIKKVTNFVFDLIPDTCDQGSFAFTIKGHPVPGMRVDAQRRFSAHYQPSSHETIDVTGKFSKSFHRASGTLRDQGDFPPQATGCDTGVDKWAASKLNVTGG
jgi:hypothetical protein